MANVDESWVRRDVSGWRVRGIETTGSSENTWLVGPGGTLWLHKDTVIPENGQEQGEDWSEVLSTQVAVALGIPCARTQLCIRHGRRGSLSLSVLPDGVDLWEGRLVLEEAQAPGYIPHAEGTPAVDPARPQVRRPGHSLDNIRLALDGVLVPPGFAGPSTLTAFDVFAGYLVLDALIANRDRHEQNWAVLTPRLLNQPAYLSPSYDHASSLGYNLDDQHRRRRLDEGTVEQWVKRGTAWRFEHVGRPPTLMAHAAAALTMCSAEGAHWWHERVSELDISPVLAAVPESHVSGMSDLASNFAHDVLTINLRRLRDVLERSS